MEFAEAFDRIIDREGGYSNHPSDPGGETMWGVTKRVALEAGYTGEMRDLPKAYAMAIYRDRYWDSLQVDLLPPDARFAVFDAAVNSGTVQATKWLQRAVNVNDDGIIGRITLLAAKNLPGATIAARISGHRLQFMTTLVQWKDFGRGWANRIAKNLMETP